MRIAFFGTPTYAVPTLDALVEAGHEVVTVVAQPDRPSGRGQKLRPPPVVVRARELGLETRQPRGIRSGPFALNFPQLDLEVGVVVAYGRILPRQILEAPRRGCINAHGSLLPRWRGAAPIERALLAGDGLTGVCTMQMDEGLDTGPILLCRETPIPLDETGASLRERLSHLSAELVVETLAALPDLLPQPQPTEGVSYASPLHAQDFRMDWGRSSRDLHDQVRAFSPKPGSWCTFREDRLKVLRARALDEAEAEALRTAVQGPPGTVLAVKRRLVVSCGTGALEVLDGQLPGRRALAGGVLANGARIQEGEVLS